MREKEGTEYTSQQPMNFDQESQPSKCQHYGPQRNHVQKQHPCQCHQGCEHEHDGRVSRLLERIEFVIWRYPEWVRFAFEIFIGIKKDLLEKAFFDVLSRGHIDSDQAPCNERIIDKPEGVGKDEDDSEGIVQPNR